LNSVAGTNPLNGCKLHTDGAIHVSGYLSKLLAKAAIKTFIERQEPEILEHFELVVNTVSMEEAVQQQRSGDARPESKAA
jgi:hypothetical protein